MRIKLYESNSFDPYENLAVEQYLLENVEEDVCILYLWQNQNTVVIGKNQNPWKECRTTLLEQEGCSLARRLSGGGAVFHDLGNLNFTFLVSQHRYDLQRQLSVICQGVNKLGIRAELSGRNDILAEGRKFSGNAFYKNGKQAYHHGTLLVDVDMQKLGRYLNPSKAKLQAKGVDSVRSRVVNLKELNPEITIEDLKKALAEAFSQVYESEAQWIDSKSLDWEQIWQLRSRNESWQWNYGQKVPFSFECEDRFSWGGIQITLQVENAVVTTAKVYSDSMDWELPGQVENALLGARFTREDLIARISSMPVLVNEDLIQLLSNQDI